MNARIAVLGTTALLVAAGTAGVALLPAGDAPAREGAASVAPAASASARASASTSTTATASDTPARTAAPAPTGSALPTATAVEAVHDYTRATDALSGSTQPDLAALQQVVSGDALQEVQAQQLELKANGQSIRGAARVTSVKLLRQGTDSGERTARIRACIDSSDVQVIGSDGKPVSSTTVGSQRALNLYDLRLQKGSWLIVRHTFPADTTC